MSFGDLIVVNVSPNQNTDLEVSCPPTQQRYVTLIAGGTANLTDGFAQVSRISRDKERSAGQVNED